VKLVQLEYDIEEGVLNRSTAGILRASPNQLMIRASSLNPICELDFQVDFY
jgi:hypothetical protein